MLTCNVFILKRKTQVCGQKNAGAMAMCVMETTPPRPQMWSPQHFPLNRDAELLWGKPILDLGRKNYRGGWHSVPLARMEQCEHQSDRTR